MLQFLRLVLYFSLWFLLACLLACLFHSLSLSRHEIDRPRDPVPVSRTFCRSKYTTTCVYVVLLTSSGSTRRHVLRTVPSRSRSNAATPEELLLGSLLLGLVSFLSSEDRSYFFLDENFPVFPKGISHPLLVGVVSISSER